MPERDKKSWPDLKAFSGERGERGRYAGDNRRSGRAGLPGVLDSEGGECWGRKKDKEGTVRG